VRFEPMNGINYFRMSIFGIFFLKWECRKNNDLNQNKFRTKNITATCNRLHFTNRCLNEQLTAAILNFL